jgi:hypothetical protein
LSQPDVPLLIWSPAFFPKVGSAGDLVAGESAAGRRHQGAAVRRIESAVAAVGGDDQIGFGSRAVQRTISAGS